MITESVRRHLRAAKFTPAEKRGRENQGWFKEKETHIHISNRDGKKFSGQKCRRGRFATALPTQLSVTNQCSLTARLWHTVSYSIHWIFTFLCRFSQPFLPPVAFTTRDRRREEQKAANWKECGCEGVYVCFGSKALAWKEIFALTVYKRGMICCAGKVRNSCNVNTVHWKLEGGVLFLGAK